MQTPKWPSDVYCIRHLPSAYNNNRLRWAEDQDWLRFVELYGTDYSGRRFGDQTIKLAGILQDRYEIPYGDALTPVDPDTAWYAVTTARKLKESGAKLPDKVFISPYLRTRSTWEQMLLGWPELGSIVPVREERVREQQHGLATNYINWRVFHVFHPEQRIQYEKEGPYYYTYPQGECVPYVRDRMGSWVTTLIREFSGENIWMIGHHLGILAFMAHVERWDDHTFINYDTNQKPINCGITHYRCDPTQGEQGRLVLDYYNRKLY